MAGRWLSAAEQRVWRDILRLERELPARINRQLTRDSGLSGPEYAVLVCLSEEPDRRLRAYQLGNALDWEQSRLSHQLSRMERRGLVARQECERDRRGAFVVLTEAGRAAIESAAPGHVAAVRKLIFDRLSDEELAAFGRTLSTILASLEEQPADRDRG
jgi:DNA-binding MarR family transcriptional regulator